MMRLGRSRGGLPLRAKMMLMYSVLVVLPLILFGFVYYQLSAKNIEDMATKNISYTNMSRRQLVDQQLRGIEDCIRSINADADLFGLLSTSYGTDYDIKQADLKITDIINKYFKSVQSVDSINIVTEQYTYGSQTVIRARDVFEAPIYRALQARSEWIIWLPTYYIPEAFQIDYLDGITDESLFPFAAMAIMNPVHTNLYNRGAKQEFPYELKRPVLMINFRPEFFGTIYGDALGDEGALYCVSDPHGAIVAHSDAGRAASSEALPWADLSGGSIGKFDYDGHRMLVSCETSEVTGWTMAVAVPLDALLVDITNLLPWLVGLEALLVALALLMVYGISSSITRPVRALTGALKHMGKGNLGGQIAHASSGEIGYLIDKFNEMSRNIQALIHENYSVKLREKEAEISALNTQLNPHLLYNTLNIINLEAIERGEPEISRMLIALSRMLQYTVMNTRELASLSEDLEWLRRYVYIMSLRYEGLFEVEYAIDDALARGQVPKLFLQPFVENAIVHGFKGKTNGCLIRVTGALADGMRVFRVTDNGRGFESGAPPAGVGIANVAKRVELIYSGRARLSVVSRVGQGTEITIALPPDESAVP